MTTKAAYDFASKTRQYRLYTVNQLAYALQDASKAREAVSSFDPAAECWYADDVHTIAQELNNRRVSV